jgi:hypothetical protein
VLGGVVEKAIPPGPFCGFGFALRARGRVAWRLKKGCQNTRASVLNPVASLILSSGKVTICVEPIMSLYLKCLIAAATSLVLTDTAPSEAVPQGFVEGNLKVVSPRAAEPSDAVPRPAVAPEIYATYPLIILSQDGQKEIARVVPDETGYYRVALPPGAYILDVQDRVAKHVRTKPQQFTVVSNETVRADMNIFRGLATIRP